MGKKKHNIPSNILRCLYVDHQFTMAEIGHTFGCSHGSVQYRLKKHGIPTRTNWDRTGKNNPKYNDTLSENQLRRLYLDKQMSGMEIADKLDMRHQTVYNKLHEFGIPLRKAAHELRGDEHRHYNPERSDDDRRLGREHWRRNREAAIQRDGGECLACDKTREESREEHNRDLMAHHIVPRQEGGSDDIDNLATLCPSCHMVLHQNDLGLDELVDGKEHLEPIVREAV